MIAVIQYTFIANSFWNDWLTILQALIGYKQQFLIGLYKNFAETWIRISYSRKFSIFVLFIFEFCCIPAFVLITITTSFVLGLFKTIWMNSTFSGKQTIQHLTSLLPFSLLLILIAWFEYTLYLMFFNCTIWSLLKKLIATRRILKSFTWYFSLPLNLHS